MFKFFKTVIDVAMATYRLKRIGGLLQSVGSYMDVPVYVSDDYILTQGGVYTGGLYFVSPSVGIVISLDVYESSYREALCAHELGHIVNKHYESNRGDRCILQEIEADFYSASKVGVMPMIGALEFLLESNDCNKEVTEEINLRINKLQSYRV